VADRTPSLPTAQATHGTDRRATTGKALVIVPTYNERDNIARLIDLVLAQGPEFEILVVDDGSPDGTGEIVDHMAESNSRVHALHRAKKLGLGTAYLAGFRWALERPQYAFVFEMDADFSHDPGHLPTFLEAIQHADVVLGSRYRFGKVTVVNWPISRLILSYAANIYARIVTGLQLYDSTGGLSASAARSWRRSTSTACARTATRSRSR